MKGVSVAGTLTNDKYDLRIKENRMNRVSKKFYADIDRRVREAIYKIGCNHDAYMAVKIVIDRYIATGVEPDLSELITVRMIFALLKSEIDKAITRSRMAKERAMARRSAKTGADVTKANPAVKTDNSEGDMNIEKQEIVTVPVVDHDTDALIDKFNAALTSAASQDKGLRPLNRRERRDLKRRMRQAKKRAMSSKSPSFQIS